MTEYSLRLTGCSCGSDFRTMENEWKYVSYSTKEFLWDSELMVRYYTKSSVTLLAAWIHTYKF